MICSSDALVFEPFERCAFCGMDVPPGTLVEHQGYRVCPDLDACLEREKDFVLWLEERSEEQRFGYIHKEGAERL